MGTELVEVKEALAKQERAVSVSVDYRKEIEKIKEQKQAMDTLIKDVLKEDVHYGLIPGCGKKPSLLKPGAEALVKLFKLTPEIVTVEKLLDAGHKEFISVGLLFYNGEKVGQASGSCSTLETKYAKKYGKANENIADTYNTCRKMSEKRALVAVVLITTGASDKFTQDVEEIANTNAIDVETKPEQPKQEAKSTTEPPPQTDTDLVLDLRPLFGKEVAVPFVCAEIKSFDKKNPKAPTVFEVFDGANNESIRIWDREIEVGGVKVKTPISNAIDLKVGMFVKFTGLTMKPWKQNNGNEVKQWFASNIEVLIEQTK